MIFCLKKYVTSLLLILAIGILGTPLLSFAQTSEQVLDPVTKPELFTENDIEFQITPEYPNPFDLVMITLKSNLINTNIYPVTWFVNDKKIKQGIGMRTLQTTMGGANNLKKITVTIELPTGSITKELFLKTSDIILTWEAIDSFVPPFYQGKKLPPKEGLVKVVALMNKSGSEPGSYRWERNGNILSGESGYEKQSVIFEHNRLRSQEKIGLVVTNPSGEKTSKNIFINFFDPKIAFYQKNMVTELFSKNATPQRLPVTDITTIRIIPYFFSSQNNRTNHLVYSWKINGNTFLDKSPRKELSIEKPEQSGISMITLEIKNPLNILQSAAISSQLVLN